MARVITSSRAEEFIAAHGGEVFAWADHAGMQHTSLHRPDERPFTEIPTSGITLWVDDAIPEALVWKIELSRFPRTRITAQWNARMPGGQVGSGVSFWTTLARLKR